VASSKEADMANKEPRDHLKVWETAFNKGDEEGIVSLFEPGGIQVIDDAQGKETELRARLREQFAKGAALTVTMTRFLKANGLALTHSAWEIRTTDDAGKPLTLTGHGTEVLREQSDGTWLLVIDDATGPV
jgi:ketosteroid isomerase-like protein